MNRAVTVGLAVWAVAVSAQEAGVSSTATAPTRRSEELFELRPRFGVVYRSGGQADQGPGLTYDGLTLNDPGLQAWVWPIFDRLGFHASFAREGFALFDRASNARITGGGLIRAQGAATARFRLGPVRLEPVAGYSLNQVAEFGDSSAPTFRPATRHGLLLAARGLVDLGPVTIEGRFDYTLGLSAADGQGAATSSGLQAGGGVRVALFRTGTLLWGLMADAAYVSDTLQGMASGVRATQSLVRTGLSVDLQWKEAERPAFAALRVTVLRDEDGSAAQAARVLIQAPGGERQPGLDASGSASVGELEPGGTATVDASLEGYESQRAAIALSSGVEAPVVLRLKKQAPKVGSLLVTAIDKATKSALAGATVVVNGVSLVTDVKGTARFGDLAPGPVSVEFSAPGFTTKSEAATIIPGVEGTVSTELVSAKKRDPATVSGFVRSARTGAPVNANLEIPEASIKAKADAKGAFAFRLTGGSYTVTISAKGFATQTKLVTVKDGDQAIFNVDLQPK